MRTAIFSVLAFVACAGGARSRVATGPVVSDQEVRAVVRRAMELDAAGQPADSLYQTGSTIVANGRPRLSSPRYAGIGRGGVLSIQNISMELSLPLAWGVVRYAWAARDGTSLEAGQATFVLERGPTGWQIVHVHSSLPVPWEANR